MPLTLSPAGSTTSTSSSPSLAEEQIGNRVDGYFPEILAQDLEISNSVFAARNMTAGPPESSLSADDNGQTMHSPWAHRSVSSPYHCLSGPGRPLGPIQERDSVVSFLNDDEHPNYDEYSTDPGSISGTDISRGPEAASASFHNREQSIITAATSLTSSSWMPSPKDSPPCDLARDHSWIDADSDEDEQEPHDDPAEENLAPLSPRPPTPPDSDNDAETRTPGREQAPSSGRSGKLHRKSYSISGSMPVSPPRRRHSGRRSESANQRSASPSADSIRQSCSSKTRPRVASPPAGRPRASSMQNLQSHLIRTTSSRKKPQNQLLRFTSDTRPGTEPARMDNCDLGSDDEDCPTRNRKESTRSPVYIRPSPPPSPLPSVQSWLNGSAGPYTAQGPGDDLARAIPLPPNVVETLRVSIACFPETMLLTSSLTLETIRNYSKKVRQPSVDPMSSNLVPDPPGSPRRSLWKRVVAYKRSATTNSERRSPYSPGSQEGTNLKSLSSASLEPPKAWAPLKNVFGHCSDYICDALWAHIVAYNYISALVPRTVTPQRRPSQGRSSTGNDSHKDEIPKKAASLLGLGQDRGTGVASVARKLGSQLSWALKDGMVAEQSPRSAMYESATRDIQAGLMRCIMRLIATAKLMAEDETTEERVVEVETRGVDVLLTRSLCEIVRMAEESG